MKGRMREERIQLEELKDAFLSVLKAFSTVISLEFNQKN